jgi:hypothetical protein
MTMHTVDGSSFCICRKLFPFVGTKIRHLGTHSSGHIGKLPSSHVFWKLVLAVVELVALQVLRPARREMDPNHILEARLLLRS